MSLRVRAQKENDLARAFTAHREATRLFLAGMLSDMMGTLPPSDPWRALSGRVELNLVGTLVPDVDGAVTADGTPFGTWRDALDVTPLIHASPVDDVGLTALAAEDLHPHAAAILAASAYTWRTALAFIEAVENSGPPASQGAQVMEISPGVAWQIGARAHHARECATAALRWAVHRRRSYRGAEDTWVGESAFRWAWRSNRMADGRGFSDEDVTAAIVAESLPDAMRPIHPESDIDDF